MLLTVAVQNIQYGGNTDDYGHREERWPAIVDRIAQVPALPDLLVLNEVGDWDDEDIARAEADLGMTMCLPVPPAPRGIAPALLYRPETVGAPADYPDRDIWGWEVGYPGATRNGYGGGVFEFEGLPRKPAEWDGPREEQRTVWPLSIAAAHLTPWGIRAALSEVDEIASMARRRGSLAIVAGDMNYSPEYGPEPDYGVMLPHNKGNRLLLCADPDRKETDRSVGWLFRNHEFLDVAWHLYDTPGTQFTGDEELMRRTGRWDRIDRIHVDDHFGPAIVGYGVMDTPVGASDHLGVWAQIDTTLIDPTNLQEYR